MTWGVGETVVVQEIWHGRLWAARPVIVVEDAPGALLAWCPKGTIRKVPVTPPERPDPETRGERLARCFEEGDWLLADSAWDVSTLMLIGDDAWHAIWVSFHEDGSQMGWYVNFQEPVRRTRTAVQTMDLALDIVVEPDRSSWRWKDEDEFDLFQRRGAIDADVAARVREDARAVVDRIERDGAPFNAGWPTWRPDPGWAIPALPEGWDTLG